MTKEFKNILEDISSSQMARLKKEYEPLRKIDMSKHKGQIEKTTAMLSKLKMGTLIDLSKEDIKRRYTCDFNCCKISSEER